MVRKLRGNLSQDAFAERIGVAQSAISNWESASAMPRLDQIESLSEQGGILPEQFVARLYGRECISKEPPDPVEQIMNMSLDDQLDALHRITGNLRKKKELARIAVSLK